MSLFKVMIFVTLTCNFWQCGDSTKLNLMSPIATKPLLVIDGEVFYSSCNVFPIFLPVQMPFVPFEDFCITSQEYSLGKPVEFNSNPTNRKTATTDLGQKKNVL